MIKKITTILLCIICCSFVYAQPRVNKANNTQILYSTPNVTNIAGWVYYNHEGVWFGWKNMIWMNRSKNNSDKPAIASGYDMSYHENIISMQFVKVKNNENIYYVLSIEKWTGYYEYPELEIDWKTRRATENFILTEDEYSKLRNINENVEGVSVYYVHDEKISSINWQEIGEYDFYYKTFYIRKEDETTVRFRYPADKRRSYLDMSEPIDFTKAYFEISNTDYNKLLITQ